MTSNSETTDLTVSYGTPFMHTVPDSHGIHYELTPVLIDGLTLGVIVDGETMRDICKRCGTEGHYSFNGHDSICYGCHGEAYGPETTLYDIVRRYVNRQKAEARRAAKAAAEAKAQADALAAWVAANADLAAKLVEHRSPVDPEGYADFSFTPRDKFLTSLADQATYKPLSEKQTAAAAEALVRLRERDEARAAQRGIDIAAGHWGEVKKRDTVIVTVEKVIVIEGDYGTSFLCIMKSTEGHSLKTFASGGSAFATDAIEAERDGQPLKIKATVKKHDEYQGVPQTIVTHCTTLPG